jgi:GH25 family lysozyme M1 (1,4-beta-N-acetylmuramidase)
MLQPVFFDCNHNNDIDFDAVATWAWAGFFKVNQGLEFTDKSFTSRRAEMEKRGLLVGGYDFATADPVAENVERFLDLCRPGPTTACCLDFEDNEHSEMTGDQAWEWLDRVRQKIGRSAAIYGGNRIREHIDGQSAKWIDMALTTPLWLCEYLTGSFADIASLRPHLKIPKPWVDFTYLQYAADGAGPQPRKMPGVENGSDLNVFDGDRVSFIGGWPGVPMQHPLTA